MPHNNQVNIHTKKKARTQTSITFLRRNYLWGSDHWQHRRRLRWPAAPCCVQPRSGTHKHTRGNKLVLLSAHMLGRKGGEAQWKLNVRGGEENRKSTRAGEEEQKRMETWSREEEREKQAKDLMSLLMRLSSIYWNQSHHSQWPPMKTTQPTRFTCPISQAEI